MEQQTIILLSCVVVFIACCLYAVVNADIALQWFYQAREWVDCPQSLAVLVKRGHLLSTQ